MVQKYADNVEYSDWLSPNNILGVEDNLCASSKFANDIIDVSFPSFGFSENPSSVDVYVKAGSSVNEYIRVYVYDGSAWHLVGHFKDAPVFCADTVYHHADVSDIIDTKEKLEAMQVRLKNQGTTGGGGAEMPPEAWTCYADAVAVVAVEEGVGVGKRRLLLKVGL